MSIEIPEFWRLVIESQLLPADECQRLGQQFGYVKGAAVQGNARTLAEWLIAENVISRYQSTILLAGRPGPFAYGDYKIYDRLEDGPLRGQFKAVHSQTGHPVVLKFFAGETVSDAGRWAETAQRAMKHTSLSHPHLWRSFELVDLEQFKFIAVQDIAGQSVVGRLSKSTHPQRVPHQEACRIAYQVALALERMHESGFVHGDLRPANIMLDGQGRGVLWCDVAQRLVPGRNNPGDAELITRADYFAPELASEGKPPDALTDVYALGCTLYEMLSGEPPFAGGDFAKKMHRHANESIQPLAPLGVPEALAKVVAYMMAKNTLVRYPQASKAAEQLGQFLESSDRRPRVAPAPPTLAAMEQYIKSKPKPTVSPVRAPTPVAATGPVVATGGNSSAVSPVNGSAHGAGVVTAASAGATGSAVVPSSASDRFKQKKPLTKNKPLLILAACGFAMALTIGILYASGAFSSGETVDVALTDDDPDNGDTTNIADNGNGDTDPGSGSENTNSGDDDPPADGGEDASPFDILAADDGQLLWLPPTLGETVDMTFVPPLAKVYLIARPSDILANTQGADAVRALGDDFAIVRQNWERAAGVKLDEIERLVIGIHPNDSQMPRFSSTVFLNSATDMKARWGNPPAGGDGTLTVKGQTAWIPPAGGGRVFVLGSAEEIQPLAASASDKPIPQFDPYFTHLLKSSDGDSHFIALFDPHFFHTDGRDMFTGSYEKVVQPLEWFFGDDAKGMLSLHFGEMFYGELRLYARLQPPPSELKTQFEDKLNEVPQRVKQYVRSLNPDEYWRPLWFEFPNMVARARERTRSAIGEEMVVINFTVADFAAPNLIAGTELSIVTVPGATYNTGGPTTTAKPSPKTLDDLLAAKVGLGFAQQSLEFSMRDLVAAAKEEYPDMPVDFQIKIIGPDLQKEGITRNQQIRDFDAKGVAVSDILTQLVRKANPVTTVQSADEIDQKLVWLVGPDPDNLSNKIILITTRTAAGEKNLTLPAVFQPK